MTTTYTPQPGSAAERAITYLRQLPPHHRIGSRGLATAIGIDPNSISALLASAMHHRLIIREKIDGQQTWRLGSGNGPAPAPAPTPEPPPAPPAAETPAPAPLRPQAWCPVAQDSEQESSPREPEPEPPAPSPRPASTFPAAKLDWKPPKVPVFLKDAPTPEPGRTRTGLEQWIAPGAKPSREVAAAVNAANSDPDFREVDRASPAPASNAAAGTPLPAPDVEFPEITPQKGAEAAHAPVTPPVEGEGPRRTTAASPRDSFDKFFVSDELLKQHTIQVATPEFRCALWSDGRLHIDSSSGKTLVLTKEETKQLVDYLDQVAGLTE